MNVHAYMSGIQNNQCRYHLEILLQTNSNHLLVFSSKQPDEESETPLPPHTPYEERPLPASKNKYVVSPIHI